MNLEPKELIEQFLKQSEADSGFELYNEAGLQHELALFLRKQFEGTRYRLQLERNVDGIGITLGRDDFTKRDMDIYIYEKGGDERYCIELKCPTHGAIPRRMFQTFEDIKFLEDLKFKAMFVRVAFIFITPQQGFREGPAKEGIYRYFREEMHICQPNDNDIPDFIRKQKNRKGELVYRPLGIRADYPFQWKSFRHQYPYFVIVF